METLTVALGDRAYPIHIGRALLDRVDLLLPFLRQPRVAIVTNVTVAPLYLQQLADTLRQVGRVDEALQQWQRVLQQRPGNPIVTEQYADALRDAGRMTEANAAYEDALRGLRTRQDRHRLQGKLRK